MKHVKSLFWYVKRKIVYPINVLVASCVLFFRMFVYFDAFVCLIKFHSRNCWQIHGIFSVWSALWKIQPPLVPKFLPSHVLRCRLSIALKRRHVKNFVKTTWTIFQTRNANIKLWHYMLVGPSSMFTWNWLS